MQIFLTNDFHNTKTKIHPKSAGAPFHYRMSINAMKACAKRLCGVTGCKCGDSFGARMTGGLIVENIDDTHVYFTHDYRDEEN